MMYGFGGNALPIMGFQTHGLMILILLVGLVLFAIWAAKDLKEKSLMTMSIILIGLGILGILFTSGWGYGGFKTMMQGTGIGCYGNENFETILDELNNEEYEGIDTPAEMKELMIEEMRERMGIENE